jgi:hypothetical protein
MRLRFPRARRGNRYPGPLAGGPDNPFRARTRTRGTTSDDVNRAGLVGAFDHLSTFCRLTTPSSAHDVRLTDHDDESLPIDGAVRVAAGLIGATDLCSEVTRMCA